MNRIFWFLAAGGIGFAADAGLLALLLALTPTGPFLARLISIGFALCVTWSINRHMTFQPSERGLMREGARYGGVGISTSIVNYLVYSGLLLGLPGLPALAALGIASLAAIALSYLGYSRLVFDR